MTTAETGSAAAVRTEPAPRPAFQTAGVPAARFTSRSAALARAARPLLWLAVVGGTVWPLTAAASAAAAVVLLGLVCAVVATRDPRIPSVTGDGERWRALLLALCALCGVAATLLEPRGAGYVTAFVGGVLIGRVVIDARLVWGYSIASAVGVGASLAYGTGSPWLLLVGLVVPALVSRALDRARLQREHARVLALLSERDALREVELAAAAGQERARIARDLHDVLAHTLSGLSLHLQGIRAQTAKRLGADDPVIGSVDRAAELARTGLVEAKQAVAALREDSSATAPRATDLAALAADHRVTLRVCGDPDALSPQVRETVFATVREGLTNAGRHAPGAAVSVSVHADADIGAVEVRVSDDGGPGADPTGAADGPRTGAGERGDVGGGKGLDGLRERAALVGGTIDAGAGDRGWSVTLQVPRATAGVPSGRLTP